MYTRLLALVLTLCLVLTSVAPPAYAQSSSAPVYEMKADTSETYICMQSDFLFFRVLGAPVSTNPAVATGKMFPDSTTYTRDDFFAMKQNYLYYTIDAHGAGTAEITYKYAADFIAYVEMKDGTNYIDMRDPQEYSFTIKVKVDGGLNPPKVEVKFLPKSTIKLVTGKFCIFTSKNIN